MKHVDVLEILIERDTSVANTSNTFAYAADTHVRVNVMAKTTNGIMTWNQRYVNIERDMLRGIRCQLRYDTFLGTWVMYEKYPGTNREFRRVKSNPIYYATQLTEEEALSILL